MTSPLWWVAARLASTLNPAEEDAVRGDLEETGVGGGEAFLQVTGLVARRQAALWTKWRPWIALLLLLGPGMFLLREVAGPLLRDLFQLGSVWWTYGVRYESGMTAGEELTAIGSRLLALAAWGWGCGFVVGHLARRTAWVVASAFVLATVPWANLPRVLPFVVIVTPLLFLSFLPLVWGMRAGAQGRVLEQRHLAMFAIFIVLSTALNVWTGGWHAAALERWSEGAMHARRDALHQWRFAAMTWPLVYLLAIQAWPGHSRGRG